MTGVVLPTPRPTLRGSVGNHRAFDDLIPHGVTPESPVPLVRAPNRIDRDRRPRATTRVTDALPTVAVIAVFDGSVVVHRLLPAQIAVIAFLLVVPGSLLMHSARVRPAEGFLRLAYAVAASIVILMAEGLAASYVLPALGVGRPLDTLPMLVVVNVLTIVLLVLATRHGDPIAAAFDAPTPGFVRGMFAFGCLPLAAAVGAQLLNNNGSSAVAIATAVAGSAVLFVVLLRGQRSSTWVMPAALFFVAVAAAWAYSMRSNNLFGFDIQQEFQALQATLGPARWSVPSNGNPYEAMLSITVVPAVLSRLSGISGVYVFKAVVPIVFGLLPVVVFAVAARWASRTAAFAAAAVLVSLPQFSGQLPAIARQEIALVIFAVMIAFAFDSSIAVRTRKLGVLVAAFGLGAAHYSTAYATVAALVIAHLLYGFLRLVRNASHAGVFTFKVVAAFAAIVLTWNVVITHSSQNLAMFLHTASERGAEILPNSRDGSLVDRWLTGNTIAPIGSREFYARARGYYLGQKKFLNFYPRSVQAQFPAVDSTAPVNPKRVAGVSAVASLLRILTSQVVLALTATGVLWLLWRRRRNDAALVLEFATLAASFLSFLMFMRVSGVAAEAYNQERAQLHASVLLSVGLATTLGWGMRFRPRLVTTLAAVAVTTTMLTSWGVTSWLGGGDISPTLANRGEAYERFLVTDPERAAARWLEHNTDSTSVIFTDRYGKLRLWGGSGITEGFDTLTPGTLDQNAFVFASRTNLINGRARGQINQYASTYVFPAAFLDANTSVLYSNPAARIYR